MGSKTTSLGVLRDKLDFNLSLLFKPLAEVHVLACGHGDTLFLRLGTKWFLIDCNLPNKAARAAFFTFVEGRKIIRLEAIFLTHPHLDHFAGMDEVIRYFSEGGREIGHFCDSGFNPKDVNHAMKMASASSVMRSQYASVCESVSQFCGQKKYYPCVANSEPISAFVASFFKCVNVQLIPIGPSPSVTRDQLMQRISKGSTPDLNLISIVLVLRLRFLFWKFTALFPGDMDNEGVEDALAEYRRKHESDPVFDLLKVPHHASAASHRGSSLYSFKKRRDAVAAVSAGTDYDVLPDREVMRQYIQNGWKVLLTTHRPQGGTISAGLKLLTLGSLGDDEETPDEPKVTSYSLTLQWSLVRGLSWTPSASEVLESQLPAYKAA